MEDLKSLQDLLDLQALDTDIDRLLDRRANLPELHFFVDISSDEFTGVSAANRKGLEIR